MTDERWMQDWQRGQRTSVGALGPRNMGSLEG